jgi:chromosome segregation ATPase
MSVRIKQFAAVAILFAVPALALAAAAPDKAEKVAQKMLGMDQSIQTASMHIDKTLTSLNALAQPGGDLVAKYKDFSKNIDDLDKVAQKAKSNAEAASKQREAYLAEWKANQDKIVNPELKQASEARRAELEPKVTAIKTSLGSARETFNPFLQDLKDLRTFLANQLNPGGIASANTLITKCSAAGEKVKSDLSMGSAAIKDLAASIAPGGAPAPKS